MADPGVTAADAVTTAAVQAAPPETWPTLLHSFGVLLLVLALLILVLWLLKRFYTLSGGAGQQGIIKLLASMYVAPKERIALVEVLGEKLLIGITPQQISFLARLEDTDNVCASPQAAGPAAGFFKALLKRTLGDDAEGSESGRDESGSPSGKSE